jgi:type I restriction enzyme S subunit
MKNGWQSKQLGDLCDVLDYKRKPITKRDRIAGKYPYYGATGVLGHVEGYLFNEPLVLVGEDGAKWESGENTAFAVEGKIWVNNHAHVLRPHRTKLLDNWLIYHLNHSDLTEFVSGLTVPKLNQGSLREIPVPLPPLPEQQQIVGILDRAFAGIATAKANAEKNLQNARALFASERHTIFTRRGPGWIERTVDEISTNLDSKRVPITKGDRKSGEYPYYGASGIVDYVADYIFDGDTLLVSEDGANLLMRSTPIAFSVSGKYWVNNHAHILKFENMATQRFVEFYLESIMLDGYVTGAAQPKLTQKALNSIPIPIPESVEAQSKIVERAESFQEETQRLGSLYERKLAALEALKKSLLHQAFTGQLNSGKT